MAVLQCGEPNIWSTNRKWIPVVYNRSRKPQNCVRHLAKQDNSCIPTSHKYMLLNNINDSTRPELGDALRKAVKCRKSAVAKVKKKTQGSANRRQSHQKMFGKNY